MEISPASKRGRTMNIVQLFNTCGVASVDYTAQNAVDTVVSSFQDILHASEQSNIPVVSHGAFLWDSKRS
jgi:hypothetical protein